MSDTHATGMRRRDLLTLIGTAAGGAVMYRAMESLGLAAESTYAGPIRLDGDPKGASVLILGAGLAGMAAALELRKAGYRVQVLEYSNRAGGRCWTLRGGDTYTELGGVTQHCDFDPGLYLNPGPWRIPYHHHALLDYCGRLKVALEPFIQVNTNAWLHSKTAFGGRPQRYRHVQADFNGYICELLAKATSQRKLDEIVTREDQEILLQALRGWGALDQDYAYKTSLATSNRRGYEKDPGGGVAGPPTPSQPLGLGELLRSGLWQSLFAGANYEFQTTLFQPVGGMDMIARAFAHEVGDLIRFNAKVKAIRQDACQVSVVYEDTTDPGKPLTATADWCLCTIPLSILSQIELSVGAPMQNAIDAVPYAPALKVGLQFRRRFWEQDEGIYGGISYTDLPIRLIGYPCTRYGDAGKAVLLGAYTIFSVYAYEFTSLSPAERVAKAVADGAQIHPQYKEEFENGIAVAWHRNPAVLGCSGSWTDATRNQHYDNLCALDGRILLAGEHASYLPGWQEGALLSSLDAVGRLHRRVLAG
ncbi:MAG TPA: flavin monoamine oxidase family protein [Xanthobacteraceae bacterium]|nr:flavin monoamine oxidase family protein [Xanthobacteraceae bacterium]